jgi:hypothetical protein
MSKFPSDPNFSISQFDFSNHFQSRSGLLFLINAVKTATKLQLFCCVSLKNLKRLREFEEIEISSHSCRGECG